MKIIECKSFPVFEKNIGQLPYDIRYKVKSKEYITFFSEDKIIVSLPSNKENARNIFYMKVENKISDTKIREEEKQIGKINYFIGNDKSKWITNIPTYSKLKYEEIYENIDLYYYINNENLEYDFVIGKDANPNDICMSFEGVDNIELDENKNIVISIGDVKVQLLKPDVYQCIDDVKVSVDCEYSIDKNNYVSFLVSKYESKYELVLDPILKLDYSTYLGGNANDRAISIAVDKEGCAYITGYTEGEYPTTLGAYQAIFGGRYDTFITKVSKDGSELIYSTYIGGSGYDIARGIAVDEEGCAYIAGDTFFGAYPITEGAYQKTNSGSTDAFITKLSKDGDKLIYSTYLGGRGSDGAIEIAVDEEKCAYIMGITNRDFPTTEGAYQTVFKGDEFCIFISKISQDGDKLMYSTYLGSQCDQYGGITVDKDGCAYVTGLTYGDFPTTEGAYQKTFGGSGNAFVSKMSKNGDKLIYSTYLGSSALSYGEGIAVDKEGCAYITGAAAVEFPITEGAYQKTYGGGDYDSFVSKLNEDGSDLIYSTYLGGKNVEVGRGIVVDKEGCCYVAGYAEGGFPTTKGAYQKTYRSGMYGFVVKVNHKGNELIYSTYVGGDVYSIAIDTDGSVYITGNAGGDFITTEGAYQISFGGVNDAFITKIYSLDLDFTWNYTPNKAKLLDNITADLIVKNLSSIELDINIKYKILDESVKYIPNSIYIQNINQDIALIPSQIYLSKIPSQENIEIRLDLEYIKEKYPEKIPVEILVELYKGRKANPQLLYSITKLFYIDTKVGPNYIQGCYDLCNLEIDGKLQTTPSGIPIIYYKVGSSYIYIEPDGDKYKYNILSNPANVVEYHIKNI